MADRAKRRRRERMILAGACQPFTLSGVIEIEAGASDATGPATTTIQAYNGGVMTVNGIGAAVVDIAGIESDGPVVLLSGHTNDLSAAMGSAVVSSPDGKTLQAKGSISRTNPAAATAIQLTRDGVPLQASIGAEPLVPPVRIREGQTVNVNGRDITAGPGGFLLFKRSRLRHIAILPNGADGSTSVSIAAAAASPEVSDMDFDKWLESMGFAKADLSEQQLASLTDAYSKLTAEASDDEEDTVEAAADDKDQEDVEAKSPEKIAAAAVATIRAQMATESARIADIRTICGVKHSAIEAQAIAEGWDKTKTELEVMRASRPNGVAAHITETGKVNLKAIEAAMCMKAGLSLNVGQGYDERTLDAADKLRHETFRDFARMIAAKNGIELVGQVGSKEWVQAAFSTSELSGIVGAVANKALQNSFQAQPSVAEKICGVANHSNYHAHTVYSLALDGELKEVGKGGEVKHLSLSEESYTRQVKIRAALLRITEQEMVNDELGAFKRNADAMARKAFAAREKAVMSAIAATGNGSSFFTTALGNYVEGSGSALSHGSLALLEKLFLSQTDPSGDPTNIEPKFLVVPPALKETAMTLMNSDYILGPVTSKQPSTNIWKGRFEPLVSPYLGNPTITGYSDTAHYIFGDPGVMPAVELAYLNGQPTPTVEFWGMDNDPETLGVTWRVVYRFGVALAEYRSGAKSRGNG
jgi:hypothetical protein